MAISFKRAMGFIALLGVQLSGPAAAATKTFILPNALHEGPVTEETAISDPAWIDGPKLSASSNDTSYEWWYFDAIPTGNCPRNESLGIIFYNAGPDGFPVGGYENGPLYLTVTGTLANGSHFGYLLDGTTQTVITESTTGLTAQWQGTGAGFTASKGNAATITYIITLTNKSQGVTGTVTYSSVAPPHLACGPNVAGQSENAFPTAYWAVTLSDANVAVNLDIAGTPFVWTGTGYHDHNWGIYPFTSSVTVSYWGRARAGPYSIVWADGIIPLNPSAFDGNQSATKEYTHAYVAQGNTILSSSCGADNLANAKVRPWTHRGDGGDAFPPIWNTSAPQGYEITIGGLPGGKSMVVNVTQTVEIEDEEIYQRFVGSASAKFVGSDTVYSGVALYEQFKLAELPPGSLGR